MTMEEYMHSDVTILGAGIAGLSLALYLAEQDPELKIRLLCKDALPECNTSLAQGGIAVVTDGQKDSFISHIKDTLQAGGGKSNHEVVETVVQEAPERLQDLLRWGVTFDQAGEHFDLHREGGHAVHRILHHKDYTGRELHTQLVREVYRHPNVELMTNIFVSDLLMKGGRCGGVYYHSERQGVYGVIGSDIVVLATGGMGQIFPFTTNSRCATGDGVGMAYRAGAKIKDLHFYQFHPTALYRPGAQGKLISEAIRGFGAYIVNDSGHRFLLEHDPRGELATRDIVSGAIYKEMQQSRADCVYLSVRHLNAEKFAAHFPAIRQTCLEAGIDPAKDVIPIVPAAHYQCGGIEVDLHSRTTLEGLYAVGECACTGLHGTNRLASNSLLEALVFAHRCAHHVRRQVPGGVKSTSSTLKPVRRAAASGNEFSSKTLTERRIQLREIVGQGFHQRQDMEVVMQAIHTVLAWRDALGPAVPGGYSRAIGEYRNMLDSALILLQSLSAAVLGQASDPVETYH